jgi:hypothetical protein
VCIPESVATRGIGPAATIDALIAFCYVCFAAAQLAVLALMTPEAFEWSQAVSAAMAALVFTVVGQRAFQWVSVPVFESLVTAVAAAYAGLLGLRTAGVL